MQSPVFIMLGCFLSKIESALEYTFEKCSAFVRDVRIIVKCSIKLPIYNLYINLSKNRAVQCPGSRICKALITKSKQL